MPVVHFLRQSYRLINYKWRNEFKRIAILLGLLSGFLVSLIVPHVNYCLNWPQSSSSSSHLYPGRLPGKSSNWFEEIINSDYNPIVKLPLTNGSSQSNEQFKSYNSKRPHFVLEELDVNDQLLIVVLTSDQTFANLGSLINQSLPQFAEKVLFFQQFTSHQQSTIEGSPSLIYLRPSTQPLLIQILDYLDSSFDSGKLKSHLRAFNFIFFINDNSYVKADLLRQLVDRLSINQHVFAPGCVINSETDCLSTDLTTDQLNQFQSGLLISNSLLSTCGNDLNCLTSASNQSLIKSYQLLPDTSDNLFLDSLSFTESLIVYPLFTTKVYVNIHHLHLQSSLNNNLQQLTKLNAKIGDFVNRNVKTSDRPGNDHWSSTWPFGIPTPHDPKDRFDVIPWKYHENGLIFMPDDFQIVRKENQVEKIDRQSIESLAIQWVNTKYPLIVSSGGEIKITNIYSRFDANRGFNYILDVLITTKMTTNQIPMNQMSSDDNKIKTIHPKPIAMRLEAVKPLVPMTIINSMPFTTEPNRITLIVPVRSDSEVSDLILLINQFVNLNNEKQQSTPSTSFPHNCALIIALITHNSSPPAATAAAYGRAMSLGISMKTKYPNLKLFLSTIPRQPNESYSTATDFGLIMILRKQFTSILTNSILVISSSNTLLTADYLSRIELNTIRGHQVYFPIPFQEYNLRPGSSGSSDSWRINKDNGVFSWFDYRHVSFYLEDLERAFKILFPSSSLSLINQLLTNYDLLEMFRQFNCQSDQRIHILRSIEPELRLRFRHEKCDLNGDKYTQKWCNQTLIYSFGNKAQMANLILNYKKSNTPIDWSQ